MKFKPLYFYSTIAVVVIIVLIIISQKSDQGNLKPEDITAQQELPDDDTHNPIKTEVSPGKDNVSEAFRHKLEMLKKIVGENPTDTLKMREYADLLASAHQKEQAIEYYQKIISIDATRTDIFFSLSFIYYSIGNLDEAERQTNKILAIDPENANAQYNLGAISAGKGNREKAKEIWMKISEQHPDEEVGIKAKESIEKL